VTSSASTTAWREGFAIRPDSSPSVNRAGYVANHHLRMVPHRDRVPTPAAYWTPATAPRPDGGDLPGYHTPWRPATCRSCLRVAAGLAEVGVASEPAARAYGWRSFPSAERFSLSSLQIMPPPVMFRHSEVCHRRHVLARHSWPACPRLRLIHLGDASPESAGIKNQSQRSTSKSS